MICIFHRYTKWSRPYNSKRTRSRGEFCGLAITLNDDIINQKRKCLRCGKVDVRYISDGYVDAEEINACMKEVLAAVALEPYPDSDLASLLRTLRIQARNVLQLL